MGTTSSGILEIGTLEGFLIGVMVTFGLIALAWLWHDMRERRLREKEREIKKWVRQNYERKQ